MYVYWYCLLQDIKFVTPYTVFAQRGAKRRREPAFPAGAQEGKRAGISRHPIAVLRSGTTPDAGFGRKKGAPAKVHRG